MCLLQWTHSTHCSTLSKKTNSDEPYTTIWSMAMPHVRLLTQTVLNLALDHMQTGMSFSEFWSLVLGTYTWDVKLIDLALSLPVSLISSHVMRHRVVRRYITLLRWHSRENTMLWGRIASVGHGPWVSTLLGALVSLGPHYYNWVASLQIYLFIKPQLNLLSSKWWKYGLLDVDGPMEWSDLSFQYLPSSSMG